MLVEEVGRLTVLEPGREQVPGLKQSESMLVMVLVRERSELGHWEQAKEIPVLEEAAEDRWG